MRYLLLVVLLGSQPALADDTICDKSVGGLTCQTQTDQGQVQTTTCDKDANGNINCNSYNN